MYPFDKGNNLKNPATATALFKVSVCTTPSFGHYVHKGDNLNRLVFASLIGKILLQGGAILIGKNLLSRDSKFFPLKIAL